MSDARALLEEYVSAGKALQLATLDGSGAPVVCNLWFASAFAADRLWFISRPDRAHCVNIRADERVAGAIVAIELSVLSEPVRGVQFVGTARELPVSGIDEDIAAYVGRHPSAANAIDPARLASGEAHHRVYRVDVTGWVLYDEVNFKPPRQDVPAIV
ncbi:pyridoxamine 5'-phosphate oxidase family protein [Phytomonospora endophytica]|uniref:Uncharacterized protein YhbP (UPF0306 family) n=1 Tax=Phytomonospora endophytica TaxID=714109 RepID=A0A841FI88_9ACTN|nr:pyridoxamine 5'-phosphate oxidase family protein [Phytomonospora endophytica]MBB6033292.1 uncharacterized protein YhbP (UPF0306 family) [Phytomonospora endophytica]GIG65519.1 hypothetical protein Pen01_18140 [Phytomonospora endophytica]